MENFSWEKCIAALWTNHRGKSLGVIFGLLISLSILIFGFFKTLFVLIFIGAGLFIGNKLDRNDDLAETAEDILSCVERIIPSFFRR